MTENKVTVVKSQKFKSTTEWIHGVTGVASSTFKPIVNDWLVAEWLRLRVQSLN